jgi:hypothetical protein
VAGSPSFGEILPLVVQRAATSSRSSTAQLRDTKFANGLDIVLDGLATRLRS